MPRPDSGSLRTSPAPTAERGHSGPLSPTRPPPHDPTPSTACGPQGLVEVDRTAVTLLRAREDFEEQQDTLTSVCAPVPVQTRDRPGGSGQRKGSDAEKSGPLSFTLQPTCLYTPSPPPAGPSSYSLLRAGRGRAPASGTGHRTTAGESNDPLEASDTLRPQMNPLAFHGSTDRPSRPGSVRSSCDGMEERGLVFGLGREREEDGRPTGAVGLSPPRPP